jgi:integrase
MPTVLSQEEVARLIASAQNLMHRTMLMMLYATGLRRAELCHLKVSDIDSKRMIIHVRQGKGGRDRDVMLTPKLLDTLREYWRVATQSMFQSPQAFFSSNCPANEKEHLGEKLQIQQCLDGKAQRCESLGRRLGFATFVSAHRVVLGAIAVNNGVQAG